MWTTSIAGLQFKEHTHFLNVYFGKQSYTIRQNNRSSEKKYNFYLKIINFMKTL